MTASQTPLRCPSAPAESAGAQVLGVVRRTDLGTRIAYVAGLAPVTEALLQAAAPAPPTSILRFAAPCETSGCRHYDGSACSLAHRIRDLLPDVATALPACAIRRSCRWFAEQGEGICHKCPQVVTRADADSVDPRLTAPSDALAVVVAANGGAG